MRFNEPVFSIAVVVLILLASAAAVPVLAACPQPKLHMTVQLPQH